MDTVPANLMQNHWFVFRMIRYAASIEKIDYEDEKVLIHYRQWSHRYDEWFDWSSPYLRPVERIQLRRQGLQEHNMAPVTTSSQKETDISY